MNTTGILYTLFFSVIVILSLYTLGFFHNMKKYSLLSQTNSNIKLVRNLVIGLSTFLIIVFLYRNNKTIKLNNKENSSIKNNVGKETSKKIYRQGYSDGQMGYGLPAHERATAYESYMANGYNFSSADIAVYEMGYNDAISGKTAEY